MLRRTARSGQGAVLAVTGEPGIGKTAFFDAVAEDARRTGYLVGTGKAEEIDRITEGAPLLVALRSGPHPLLDEKAFADLAPLRDSPLWLVDRVAVLLEERALDAPVLVGVDDLQWADGLTRFALRILTARLTGSPVVWLLAGRSVEGRADQRIALGPLDAVGIEELARDRLGSSPDRRTAALLGRVGGNPFWAVRVLDAAWDDADGDLPAEVVLGVRRRMPSLSADLVRLLRICAVWGRAIAADQAAVLLGGLPAAVVLDAAEQGAAEGLLRRDGWHVSFRHDLLREAVYADLGADDRFALHRACGRLLLDDPLAAAPHFQVGAVVGDHEAVAVLRAAAAVSAVPDVAADLALRAFGLTAEDSPSWAEVGEECAELLVRLHRGRQAVEVVDRLLPHATDADTRARLQVLASRALWSMNRLAEIGERTRVPGDLSPTSRARLAAAGTLALVRVGTSSDAAREASAALAEARRVGDGEAERLALLTLSVVARQEGRHAVAHARVHALRALAGDEHLAEEIRALQMLDRYHEAAVLLADAGDSPDLVHARMWQDVNLGRLDEAEAQANTLVRLADEVGEHVSTLDAGSVLAFVAMVRGDFATARSRLAAHSRPSPAIHTTATRLMRGWISLLEGRAEEAAADYRPLLAVARTSREYWPWFPLWTRPFVQVGLAVGDHAFASEAAALAETAAERNPGVASFGGLASHTRGLVDGDVRLLGDAVAVLREGPRPLLLAAALGDLGTALLEVDRDEAVRRLTEARRLYDAVGAVLPAAVLDRALGGAGRRGPRPTFGWESLTATESAVAELVGNGHTNRSAAAELGVSVNTVGTHVRSVFAKLDVRSRVQLANLLHRRG